jgi:hypothetical protein
MSQVVIARKRAIDNEHQGSPSDFLSITFSATGMLAVAG